MTLKLSAPNKLVGFVAEHLKSSGAGIRESRDPFIAHELFGACYVKPGSPQLHVLVER